MKKCFEGIQKLKFDEKRDIHGMYSSETEYVPFNKTISTDDARGNVDEWLLWTEEQMIAAVKA